MLVHSLIDILRGADYVICRGNNIVVDNFTGDLGNLAFLPVKSISMHKNTCWIYI